MPLLLALDTSTVGCSVAMTDGDNVVAAERAYMQRGQSEELAPMIERVLQASGRRTEEVDAVVVTRGPGAFTGLRIGLAAARGLALALGKPCIGVTSFAVLARAGRAAAEGRPLLIAIDTKREDLYVQLFGAEGGPLADGIALAPSALRSKVESWLPPNTDGFAVAGDAQAVALDALTGFETHAIEAIRIPDAVDLAHIGAALLEQAADHPPTPLYLRPPDVTIPNA